MNEGLVVSCRRSNTAGQRGFSWGHDGCSPWKSARRSRSSAPGEGRGPDRSPAQPGPLSGQP